jgi:hypothetical protein
VALAAAEHENIVPDRGIFEPTHRDSLHIIGATTISLPDLGPCTAGCIPPVTGVIDSFLPITYPDDLRSDVYHPIGLGHEFQDFTYSIDSSLKSLTFAFASTDYPEVVGIDSVRITGDPLSELPVALDIKPGSCPNPINVKSKGVLPTAIVGTSCFDVTQIDPASILLEGVAPTQWAYVDITSPFEPHLGKQDCDEDFDELYPDGLLDLAINFDRQEIIAALGDIEDGECLILHLTGNLKEEFGGTPIVGQDVILILERGNN